MSHAHGTIRLDVVLSCQPNEIEDHVRAYFDTPKKETVYKKHVVALDKRLEQEFNAKRYRTAGALLILIHELAMAPNNCKKLVNFGVLRIFQKLLARISSLEFSLPLVELLKDLLPPVHHIAMSSSEAKKAVGEVLMLGIWDLVKYGQATKSTTARPFLWLKLAQSKDQNEVFDAAVETVNALLEGCRDNERFFSSHLELSDELKCLFLMIKESKDYPTQAVLFEVFYRLARRLVPSVLLDVFNNDKGLYESFSTVKSANFQGTTRTFLMFLNYSLEVKRVLSFPYKSITLNEVHLSEGWVDFGELATTFYWNPKQCSEPQLFSDPASLTVRILYEEITNSEVLQNRMRWRIDGKASIVPEIAPKEGQHVFELEFAQPETLMLVQEVLVSRMQPNRDSNASVKVRPKASRATVPMAVYARSASPVSDERLSFFTSQPVLSQNSSSDEDEAQQKPRSQTKEDKQTNGCEQQQDQQSPSKKQKGKRARSNEKREQQDNSQSEEGRRTRSRGQKEDKPSDSSSPYKPQLSPRKRPRIEPAPTLPEPVVQPSNNTTDTMEPPEMSMQQMNDIVTALRCLQDILKEKTAKSDRKCQQLGESVTVFDQHLSTLLEGDARRDDVLCKHDQALEKLEAQCLSTIRDMKREQEAYNAKMNDMLQQQLDEWLALRENRVTLSRQLAELERAQNGEKAALQAALARHRTMVLKPS